MLDNDTPSKPGKVDINDLAKGLLGAGDADPPAVSRRAVDAGFDALVEFVDRVEAAQGKDEAEAHVVQLMQDAARMVAISSAWPKRWSDCEAQMLRLRKHVGADHRKRLEVALHQLRTEREGKQGSRSHPKPHVYDQLERTKAGVASVLPNRIKILQLDHEWLVRLRHDAFADRVFVDERELDDDVVLRVALEIYEEWGVSANLADTHAALVHTAKACRSVDPLKARLDALRWDGTPRLHNLLSAYFGAAHNDLHSAYSTRWCLQAVARAYQPGCKADCVLILHGAQGTRKSTALRVLALEDAWFSDADFDIHKIADAALQLAGKWLYEVAEWEQFRGRDATTIKAWLSRQEDRYRPPYGRNSIEAKRRSVFVATTNNDEVLDDPSGSRRFWPVSVGTIRVESLKADREQLWAEAVARYKKGERWHLNEEEDLERQHQAGRYQRQDPWAEIIVTWLLGTSDGFTTAEVLQVCLKKDVDKISLADGQRVGRILRELGYRVVQHKEKGERSRRYYRGDNR